MKNIARQAIMMTLFFLLCMPVARANSVTYTISARIPAIPGVNVPPFDDPQQAELHQKKKNLEIIKEKVWRDNQRIVLVTITEK